MRTRSSATALLVTVLLLLSLASRPVAAPSVQDPAAAPGLDVAALRLEHRLTVKTVEAATLKVELYRSQLSLVSVLLQQAQAEAAASDRPRQAVAARGREELGAQDGDAIDWETMSVRRGGGSS